MNESIAILTGWLVGVPALMAIGSYCLKGKP